MSNTQETRIDWQAEGMKSCQTDMWSELLETAFCDHPSKFNAVCDWAAQVALSRRPSIAEREWVQIVEEEMERHESSCACGAWYRVKKRIDGLLMERALIGASQQETDAPTNDGGCLSDEQETSVPEQVRQFLADFANGPYEDSDPDSYIEAFTKGCKDLVGMIGEQETGANPQEGEDDPFGPVTITEADRDDLSFLKRPTPSRVTVDLLTDDQWEDLITDHSDSWENDGGDRGRYVDEDNLRHFLIDAFALLASQEDGEREWISVDMSKPLPVGTIFLCESFANGWDTMVCKWGTHTKWTERDRRYSILFDSMPTPPPFPNNTVEDDESN